MTDAVVAGILAGYGIAMPVGAVSVLLVTLAARSSLRTSLAAAMGTGTADGVYALIAVLGGAALATVLAEVAAPVRWIAALVLLVIGVHGLLAALRRHTEAVSQDAAQVRAAHPWGAYTGLLGVTMLNPTTVVYFAALVFGQQATGWSAGHAVAFVLAAFVASSSWQVVLVLGGTALGATITSPRGRMVTGVVGNTVIIGLALHLVWTVART